LLKKPLDFRNYFIDGFLITRRKKKHEKNLLADHDIDIALFPICQPSWQIFRKKGRHVSELIVAWFGIG
jgi:hypothetical protein